MKNLIIASILIPLLSFTSISQAQDVRLSKRTVEQAKSENKFILIISHTPHGSGATALFENKHLSQFLNRHFIIEKQASKSGKDSYLIFNQQRELVHRVADEKYPYELAAKIKRALDTRTQYYTLLSRFESGDRSTDLLTDLIVGATDAADVANAPRFMQAYLEALSLQPDEANLRFILRHTTRSSDPGFTFLLEGEVGIEKLADIVFQEIFVTHLNDKAVDAVSLADQAKILYPAAKLSQHIDRMPIELLEMREDWEGLKKLLPRYLSTHGTHLRPAQVAYYNELLDRRTTSE